MTINKYYVPAVAIALLFAIIFVASAAGWWQTSGKVAIEPGSMTSADVRGWMSLQDVVTGSGLSVETLYARLGLPSDMDPATALKDLEKLIDGFEVSTVRDAIAEDYVEMETTQKPEEEQTEPEPTATHVPIGEGEGGPPADRPDDEVEITLSIDIRGKSTLQEVIDTSGVSKEALYEALGFDEDMPTSTQLKTLKDTLPDFTIGDVRAAIGELAPELVVE